MRLNPRILAPAALIALGVWLLVGCVYIPTFGTTVSGKNASKSVGSKQSRSPVRATRSTVADVIRVLGEPAMATRDRRVLGYSWQVRNGYAVWPLCFAGHSVNGRRTLVLRFDDRDVLKSFEVLKSDDPLLMFQASAFSSPVPAEIMKEQLEEGRRATKRRRQRAATRPTTAPARGPATAPVTQPR